MEKIIQINYQGRNISIEENAYTIFNDYEAELKNYFLKEEGGEETFTDLQNRMSEILEQKNNSNNHAVNVDDIQELIATIGRPADLAEDQQEFSDPIIKNKPEEKKKLVRNKNGRLIAGVCSGIAHYFSMDPIAVRIIFVVFTIFNIATLLSFNIGILAYLLLWIILPSAYLKTNIQRKLFRNPKDRVIGGVCSGLAQFFNIESWIIRLIFIAPLILGFISNHNYYGGRDFDFLGHSFSGLSFITYLIFWVIIPMAKSSTDYMLLKGEPINISTIQNSSSMSSVAQSGNSGLNKFLKVVAYIIIGMIMLFMIPLVTSLLVGSFFSYHFADIILFTSFNKTLALFIVLFVMALPLVAIIVWLIRRIAGYKHSNKPLRLSFIGLFILGIVSAIFLTLNLIKVNNTYVSKPEKKLLWVPSDTLYILPIDSVADFSEDVVFKFNQFDHILQRDEHSNMIKAVRVKYKRTDDTMYSMEIEKSGFGQNKHLAEENALSALYESNLVGNKLYLGSKLSINNKLPYHFQNIKVTIFIPRNKKVIVSNKMKQQLRHSIRTNHKDFNYNYESIRIDEDDEIISFDTDEQGIIRISDDPDYLDKDAKAEARELLKDAQLDAQLKIEDAKRELEQSNQEAQRQIEESKREAALKIDEAKRKLEEAQREAQQKLEEESRNAK